MFRIVGHPDDVLGRVKKLEPLVAVEEVLRVSPVVLRTIPVLPGTLLSAQRVPGIGR